MDDNTNVDNSGARIIKNVVTQGFTYVIRAVSNFLIIVFIARLAGPESLGIYSFAITFTLAATFLTDLGISLLLIREIARDRANGAKYISNAFTLMLMLAPAVILLLVFAVNVLDHSVEKTYAVYLAAFALVLFSFTSVFKSAFYASERMEFWTITITAQETVFLAVGLTVLYLEMPFLSIFVSYALSRLVGLVVAGVIYHRNLGSINFGFDWSFSRRLIQLSLPFAAAAMLNVLYARSAILLLSRFQGNEATGYYEAAYNLSIRLVLLARMINIAMLPALTRFFQNRHEQFVFYVDQATRYSLILGIPLVFSFSLLAERLIPLVYSADFTQSVVLFRILLFAVIFKMLGNSYGTALTAADNQVQRTISIGFAAALNLALNLLLIPRISSVGAAIAAVLTEVVLFLMFLLFARKSAGTRFRLSLAWKPLLAAIPMTGVILLVGDLPVLATLGLGLLIYGFIFILLRGFAAQEIAAIRRLLQGSV